MPAAEDLLRAVRHEGPRSVAWRVLKRLAGSRPAHEPELHVFPEDVLGAEWASEAAQGSPGLSRPRAISGTGRVAWVVSPPSASSGGHQTAFRFISALERAGHPTTVYLYHARRWPRITVDSVRALLEQASGLTRLDAQLRMYDPVEGIEPGFDALFATDWPTAYAVSRYPGPALRFSFVQDLEALFYPRSSEFVLAESSHRLGLHAITMGPWLARRLREDHGVRADAIEFGVDTGVYRRSNDERRREIAFYTRPPTPRRGHELGMLALQALHEARPDIPIHLVGWELPASAVPFPAVRHGLLDPARLAELYNRCAAVLSISLTNMSLVPLEAMAAGAVAVVNDGDSTRDAIHGHGLVRAQLSPAAMARALAAAVDDPRQRERSRRIAASVRGDDWAGRGERFVRLVEDALRAAPSLGQER